jgi:hypothetical protein
VEFLTVLAQLAIATGGLLTVARGFRSAAWKLAAAGLVMVISAVVIPTLARAPSVLGVTSDLILAWVAVAGVCAAILGRRSWAVYLIAPAVIDFVVLPAAAPLLGRLFSGLAHYWVWATPLFLLAPLILVVVALRAVIAGIAVLFGPRVAGHVGGVFVTRLCDWLTGRGRGRSIPEFDQHSTE